MPGKTALPAYHPGHLCPKCGAEGSKPYHHARPVLAVFGAAPSWPCSGIEMDGAGEHMCLRCESCGHAWMMGIVPGMADVILE